MSQATVVQGTGSTPSDGDLTIERMRADVAEMLGESPEVVRDDGDLLQLGLDSIGVMRLASRWRQYVEVSFGDLIEWRTLAEWHELVSGAARAVDGTGPADRPMSSAGVAPYQPW